MFSPIRKHIPCRQKHPEDIPKNKTQHYSGITDMSREGEWRNDAPFFTLLKQFRSKNCVSRSKFRQNKTARRPFLHNLHATYWKSSDGCNLVF
jgi:hypothetical protein